MATDTAQEVMETAFETANEALRVGTTEALRLANSTEQGRELVEMTGSALEQAGHVLQDAGKALKDLPAVAASEVKPKSKELEVWSCESSRF